MLHHAEEARFDALENAALSALARELSARAAGGARTTAAAQTVAAALNTTAAGTLSQAVETLVVAAGDDGSEAFRDACWRLTLDYGTSVAKRGRSWFKAMGFDAEPDRLGDIPDMLAAFEHALVHDEQEGLT